MMRCLGDKMKKWVKITDERPPINTLIRVKRLEMKESKECPIGGIKYHNKHWPDGIYEGEFIECGSLCGFNPHSPDTVFFLNVEAWDCWEKESFTPIKSRFEILDL